MAAGQDLPNAHFDFVRFGVLELSLQSLIAFHASTPVKRDHKRRLWLSALVVGFGDLRISRIHQV